MVLVIAASAGCVATHEITFEGCGETYCAQSLARANAGPLFDSMLLSGIVQYVETDEVLSPTLHFLPESMSLPRQGVSGAQQWRGFMFIANTGHANLTRSEVSITGPDSEKFRLVSSHAPTIILPPGKFEDFEVEYVPRHCHSLFNPLAADEAELRIVSDAGVVVMPLIGNRWNCAQRVENTKVKST
jgi:hypothetical protein